MFNLPPTDIQLSATDVYATAPAGTAVGTLTSSDPNTVGESFTYSLLSGSPSFYIDGNILRVSAPPGHRPVVVSHRRPHHGSRRPDL